MPPFTAIFLIFAFSLRHFKLTNFEIMGKGDKKSKRGKIIRGTYGVSRPRKAARSAAPRSSKEAEVSDATARAAARPAARPARAAARPAAKKSTKPAAAKKAAAATGEQAEQAAEA